MFYAKWCNLSLLKNRVKTPQLLLHFRLHWAQYQYHRLQAASLIIQKESNTFLIIWPRRINLRLNLTVFIKREICLKFFFCYSSLAFPSYRHKALHAISCDLTFPFYLLTKSPLIISANCIC